MDIKKIDKNFDTTFVSPADIEWFSIQEVPFSVHGIFYAEEEGLYRRLPKGIADATNEGVAHLSKNTAGGRVRFITDSPYIAVRLEEPFEPPCSHMTIAGVYGVSVFADKKFVGTIMPSYEQIVNADSTRGGNGKIAFDGIKSPWRTNDAPYQVEMFLPLYSAINSMYVGLKKGCMLQPPKAYTHPTPVLFYGSSITQGACASKPADDYINRLSRMLDLDYINLGFSGSAKAEKVIADYIAKQNSSVFVMDYDHNAPDAEHLKKTHFALYETIRKANPTTPIIMMTMPTIDGYQQRDWNQPRREEILKSFAKAKGMGDENVYLIDCYGSFGILENGECGTIDDCHPNSLGFFRMAERVYPLLNKLLNGEK
jgi:lysophospholipase L1-like esterase